MFGIRRVVEECLCELDRDPRVELTLMGIAGADRAASAAYAADYARTHWPTMRYDRVVHSRLGADRAYDRLYGVLASGGRGRELAARSLLKALKAGDARAAFDERYEVYHSTFLPLPAPGETGSARRVLSVYDLIPVTDPWAATPEQGQFTEQ